MTTGDKTLQVPGCRRPIQKGRRTLNLNIYSALLIKSELSEIKSTHLFTFVLCASCRVGLSRVVLCFGGDLDLSVSRRTVSPLRDCAIKTD